MAAATTGREWPPPAPDAAASPPFFERAATFSYTLVDEFHYLIDSDADAIALPAANAGPGAPRLDALRRRIAVCGLIVSGTLISTLGKLVYETTAVGRDGELRPFHKPWFLVLLMFTGMAMNLPLSLLLDLVRHSRRHGWRAAWRRGGRRAGAGQRQPPAAQRGLQQPLLQFDYQDDEVLLLPGGGGGSPSASASVMRQLHRRLVDRQLLLLLVPALFDLAGAALLNVGLLAVTASATQMLRQSLLLFAALLAAGLWGKRLNGFHAAGLCCCAAGLSLVAAACLASGYGGSYASPHRSVMAGCIGLILASQLAAAGQLLIDQRLWGVRLQLSPLKIVGCEGLIGAALVAFVVLPLAGVSGLGPEGWGASEDTIDTLAMVASRPRLLLLLLVYMGSLQAYNICGMGLAGELTAVDTTLLAAVRTLFVWIINLLIYAAAAALAPETADDLQPLLLAPALAPDAAPAVPGAALAGHASGGDWGWGWAAALAAAARGAGGAAASLAGAAASAAPLVLPGEPWTAWSFMQAGGYLMLVLAAIAFSRGDTEGWRRQLEAEAALIMADVPPSVAGSLASGSHPRRFTANMDIDTAAYLRFAWSDKDGPHRGVTPTSAGWSLGAGGGQRSGGAGAGLLSSASWQQLEQAQDAGSA